MLELTISVILFHPYPVDFTLCLFREAEVPKRQQPPAGLFVPCSCWNSGSGRGAAYSNSTSTRVTGWPVPPGDTGSSREMPKQVPVAGLLPTPVTKLHVIPVGTGQHTRLPAETCCLAFQSCSPAAPGDGFSSCFY